MREEGGAAADRVGAGDHRAPAAPEFDQSLVAQSLVAAEHGVDVDAQGVGEGAGGGEPVAGGEAARGDGGAGGGRDLVAERYRGAGVDVEQHGQRVSGRRSASVLRRAAAVPASSTVTANSRPSPVLRTTSASPER